tara:strand:- start:2879 stop:3565 length:687 start_codon:yes stop_codon:yes gene_type:complete
MDDIFRFPPAQLQANMARRICDEAAKQGALLVPLTFMSAFIYPRDVYATRNLPPLRLLPSIRQEIYLEQNIHEACHMAATEAFADLVIKFCLKAREGDVLAHKTGSHFSELVVDRRFKLEKFIFRITDPKYFNEQGYIIRQEPVSNIRYYIFKGLVWDDRRATELAYAVRAEMEAWDQFNDIDTEYDPIGLRYEKDPESMPPPPITMDYGNMDQTIITKLPRKSQFHP